MYEFKLKLKNITPVFMYGTSNEPELRPSEFKGIIRFWARFILDEKREKEIFGTTKQKSKVQLKLYVNSMSVENFNNAIRGKTRYLWFSPFIRFKKERLEPKLIKDCSLELKLTSLDKNALLEAEKALWFAIYLFGFGARARRGGGNFSVLKEEGFRLEDLPFVLKGVGNLKNFIKNGLKNILEKRDKEREIKTIIKFPEIIFIKKLSQNPQESFNKAAEILQELRTKLVPYLNRSKKIEPFKRIIFGAPLAYGGIGKNMKLYNIYIEKQELKRRSSPFVIKFVQDEKKYFWLITYFLEGDLLPGEEISIIGKRKEEKYKLSKKELEKLKETRMNYLKKEFEILWRAER